VSHSTTSLHSHCSRNESVDAAPYSDMAWDHLMSDRFRKLRDVIFATPDDLARFRSIVVNVVLATVSNSCFGSGCIKSDPSNHKVACSRISLTKSSTSFASPAGKRRSRKNLFLGWKRTAFAPPLSLNTVSTAEHCLGIGPTCSPLLKTHTRVPTLFQSHSHPGQ
jgi:hypothetical protein